MASTSTDSIAVLHVDDEPDFTDMAATFVEREDDRFYVETATGPSEALDRLDGERFDCIVSDYDMPRRNGIEFLEAVREDFPDIPFILFTGKGSEEVASDAISAGVTDYLQKGSGTSQYAVLANRIRNAVDKYYAQTELADREKRLNLFFEQSPLGVVEWDEQFDFVRINDAGEDILGYAQDDLVGRSWETIVPEPDRDAVAEVVTDLLENKGGYHSVNENVRKDGERIVCEWHNRVVTDDDGDVVAIFSQFQDITERRRRQRQFEAVFNNTHTLTGLMEPDGTVI
jgi:PAS domain S-box-containing protein